MFPRRLQWLLAGVIFILGSDNVRADYYDIADQAKKGATEDQLLAAVNNSPDTYDLSADDIQYLTDLGVPDPVIVVMIHKPAEVFDVAYARADTNDPSLRDYGVRIPGHARDFSHCVRNRAANGLHRRHVAGGTRGADEGGRGAAAGVTS